MKVNKYYWMKNQSRHENIIYLTLWGMLFAAPVLSMYVRVMNGDADSIDWNVVLMVWRQFAVYCGFFLFHNFFLAPLLVHEQRRLPYFSVVTVILGVFMLYQCNNHLAHPHHPKEPLGAEMTVGRGPGDDIGQTGDHKPADGHEPMGGHELAGGHHAPPHRQLHLDHKPPPFIGEHDIVATVVLLLMFGMNLGVKLYFKTRRDQKKLTELQKENLRQQLEYLKYQINPHFFMNTLNNIHALVDIDPEKAKSSIVELSKMMRFILYEGDKHGVPLSMEFDFIRHYITLMRLRYTDKVRISVTLPAEAPDKTIPPLMLISFIENAFKHGISYQHPSFVEAEVSIESGKLHFNCRNSKADRPNQEKGGVGLANVKQRLHLLYDNNFTLSIQDNPDTYHVELIIPLQ